MSSIRWPTGGISRLVRPAFLVGASLLLVPSYAPAAVLNVPATYGSIQAAVTAAATGDTIVVTNGPYTEYISIAATKTGITVKADGRVNLVGGFHVLAPYVTVEGFHISGGMPVADVTNGFLVSGSASNMTIRNNHIENISGRAWEVSANCHYLAAISNRIYSMERGSYVNNPCHGLRVLYNYFDGRYNTFDGSGSPGLSNALYEYNTFVGIEPTGAGRLGMTNTSAFRNNNFYQCSLGVTWRWGPVIDATNNWWGTTNGPLDPLGTVEVAPGDAHPGAINLLNAEPAGQLGPLVADWISSSLTLYGSTNIDYFPWAMEPIPNGYSFPTQNQVWVSGLYSPAGPNDGHTWGVDAFSNIQEAVNAIFTGTVWVAAGTYTLMEPIWIAKGVTVRSVNGASQTIIDGNFPAVTSRCFYVNHSNAVLEGFTILNGRAAGTLWTNKNWGGGVYCPQGLIQDCIITSNTAVDRGGGVWLANRAILRNCVVTRNGATNQGGGVYVHNFTGVVQNCTIAFNTAGKAGGGLCVTNGGCLVENTIVYYNVAPSGANWAVTGTSALDANSYARYGCSPEDLSTYGPGNLRNPPRFQGPDNGNYRIMVSSPCLNTGTNAAWIVPGTTKDLDGRDRIIEGQVDIGAYEIRPNRGMVLILQ